ncbi:MAG: heavy metal translocating P-type ATPase [Clostridia bacterium]|nr:heavy metal translocating P-type ATPase [Clostridia bacterium]
MKQKFTVTGMTCSACSAHVEKAVRALSCVAEANVNLLLNSLEVTYRDQAETDAVIDAVVKAGYGAAVFGEEKKTGGKGKTEKDETLKNEKKRILWSLAFLLPLMYLSMGPMLSLPIPGMLLGADGAAAYLLTQFLLTIPVIVFHRRFFTVGFRRLFSGSPNMDSLVSVGSGAALLYSVIMLYLATLSAGNHELLHTLRHEVYFEAAAMILTLVSVGKFMEARQTGKTSQAIQRLVELTPPTAIVLRDGEEKEISIDEVRAGELLVIKPGAKIPVDGVVQEGFGAVDESALTGESIPVDKTAGDAVTGGSVNQSGAFIMRAECVGEQTVLAQMIRMVENAAASKAPVAKLADKVSGIFVPTVIAIAIVTFIAWLLLGATLYFALSCAISVLVISCPCALGLATPTAIMVGMGKGAEYGILFKNAESLEAVSSVQAIVLDKTGTVTEGQPRASDVDTDMAEEEFLRLVGSGEQLSEHPLALAVVEKCRAEGIKLSACEDFYNETGSGIRAVVDGKKLLVGNRSYLLTNGVDTDAWQAKGERLSNEGKTVLYVAIDGKASGLIAVADPVRTTSREAIAKMKKMGLSVVMLTGDNRRTAERIAEEVGVDRVISEVLPQDKEREIRRLKEQGKQVAMVGDGINDAPALSRADIGFAIGAGTDIAIEAADVVLVRNDLSSAVTAIRLGKSTMRNIKQNLFWAFFYNCIVIPLAAGMLYPVFGLTLSPMIGALAMSLSSVSVVSNALRLRFFQEEKHKQIESEYINKTGGKTMEKKMVIEGMACAHCSARVEQVLNAIDGVKARVVLEDKCAYITLEKEVTDETLIGAVTEAGYTVVSLSV